MSKNQRSVLFLVLLLTVELWGQQLKEVPANAKREAEQFASETKTLA
jgi:hypothetical protein